MSGPVYTFRAVWPILDESEPYGSLCRQATADLPTLIAQAHAVVLTRGRFSIAPSSHVPGSGRITDSVLVFEAPAVQDNKARPWLARTA